MNKITEVGNNASQTFADLESPARRLFVKGVAGLGAAFASSSLLSAGVPAQAQSRGQAASGNQISSAPDALGTFYSIQRYRPLPAA